MAILLWECRNADPYPVPLNKETIGIVSPCTIPSTQEAAEAMVEESYAAEDSYLATDTVHDLFQATVLKVDSPSRKRRPHDVLDKVTINKSPLTPEQPQGQMKEDASSSPSLVSPSVAEGEGFQEDDSSLLPRGAVPVSPQGDGISIIHPEYDDKDFLGQPGEIVPSRPSPLADGVQSVAPSPGISPPDRIPDPGPAPVAIPTAVLSPVPLRMHPSPSSASLDEVERKESVTPPLPVKSSRDPGVLISPPVMTSVTARTLEMQATMLEDSVVSPWVPPSVSGSITPFLDPLRSVSMPAAFPVQPPESIWGCSGIPTPSPEAPAYTHCFHQDHSASRPRRMKEVELLNLGNRELTPFELDQWMTTFKFSMDDACPGLSPAGRARMLVHNTARTDNNGLRLQDYVADQSPSLADAVQFVKSQILQPVDIFQREWEAANISWEEDTETIMEYRDRLLRLMQEAAQTRILSSESLVRAADRFFLGLSPDCRAFIVNRDTPMELEALFATAVKWRNNQTYLEFARRHDERRRRCRVSRDTVQGCSSRLPLSRSVRKAGTGASHPRHQHPDSASRGTDRYSLPSPAPSMRKQGQNPPPLAQKARRKSSSCLPPTPVDQEPRGKNRSSTTAPTGSRCRGTGKASLCMVQALTVATPEVVGFSPQEYEDLLPGLPKALQATDPEQSNKADQYLVGDLHREDLKEPSSPGSISQQDLTRRRRKECHQSPPTLRDDQKRMRSSARLAPVKDDWGFSPQRSLSLVNTPDQVCVSVASVPDLADQPGQSECPLEVGVQVPVDSVTQSQDSLLLTSATRDQRGRMRGRVSLPKTPPLGPLVTQLNQPLRTCSHRTDRTPLVQLDPMTLGRERTVSQPVHTMHPSPGVSSHAGTDSAGTSGTVPTVDTRTPGQPGTNSSSRGQQSGQGDSSPPGQGSGQDSGPQLSSGESPNGPHPLALSPTRSPVRELEYSDEFFLAPGTSETRSPPFPVNPVAGTLGIPPPVAVDPGTCQDADGPQTSVMQPFRDTGWESIPLLPCVQSIHQIRHNSPIQSQAAPPAAVSLDLVPMPGTLQHVPIPHPAIVSVTPIIPPGVPVLQEGLSVSPVVSQLDPSFVDPVQITPVIAHRQGLLQHGAIGRQAVMELQAQRETLKGQVTQLIGEREDATQAAAVYQGHASGFQTESETGDQELRTALEKLQTANQDTAQFTQGLTSLQGAASQLYSALAQVNPIPGQLALAEIIEWTAYMTNQLWIDKTAVEWRAAALQTQLAALVTTVMVDSPSVCPTSTPQPHPVAVDSYSIPQPLIAQPPRYIPDGGLPTVTQSLQILQAKQQPFTYVQPGYQPPSVSTTPVQSGSSTASGIVHNAVSGGQYGLGAQLTAPLTFSSTPPVSQAPGISAQMPSSHGVPGQRLVYPPSSCGVPGHPQSAHPSSFGGIPGQQFVYPSSSGGAQGQQIVHPAPYSGVPGSQTVLSAVQPLVQSLPSSPVQIVPRGDSDSQMGPLDTQARTQNNERWDFSSSGCPRSSKSKQPKRTAQLSLSDKKLMPLKLDQWIKTFRFIMEDECPRLSPVDQARVLVHNTVRTDYHGQRFQDSVLDSAPTLEETVDWIKGPYIRLIPQQPLLQLLDCKGADFGAEELSRTTQRRARVDPNLHLLNRITVRVPGGTCYQIHQAHPLHRIHSPLHRKEQFKQAHIKDCLSPVGLCQLLAGETLDSWQGETRPSWTVFSLVRCPWTRVAVYPGYWWTRQRIGMHEILEDWNSGMRLGLWERGTSSPYATGEEPPDIPVGHQIPIPDCAALKAQAVATAKWRPSRETIMEFWDGLLCLTQEAMQTWVLISASLVRAVDRFSMGLTPDGRAALVEKDIPMELEPLHAAAAKWVGRQKALELARGADDRRKWAKEKFQTSTGTTFVTALEIFSSPRRQDMDSGQTSPSSSLQGPRGRFQKRTTGEARRRTLTPPASKDTKTKMTWTSDDHPSAKKTSRSLTPNPTRSPSPDGPSDKTLVRFGCRERGHIRTKCPSKDYKCHICGRTGHVCQHCANVTAARDKAAARVQYMNHNGEADSEDFGSQDSIYRVIIKEESVEDVSIHMMSIKGPDDPLVADQLTSHEYMGRLTELRTAARWTALSSEEKQNRFQAEDADRIDHGKIPCDPRMQQLITRDTLVDGLKVPTVYDCESSVCLIPWRILLQLVAARGDEFYLERVLTTNLQIRDVTNPPLSTGQQVVLHLDIGVVGPIWAPPTLKTQACRSTSVFQKEGTVSSNSSQVQSSIRSSRPVHVTRPRSHSGPPPGLTRLRRNSSQAYRLPVGHPELTPDDVAWYWRHKLGPPSKVALKRVSRQLIPDLVSVQERCESTLDRIQFRPSFSQFRNRWLDPSPRVQVNPAQLSGTLVLPYCPFRESMVYKSCRQVGQRCCPSPGFLQTQIPGQTTKVWERGTLSQEPVMDKIPVDITPQGSPKPLEMVIGPVTRDGISPILLPQEGILPDAIKEEGILSSRMKKFFHYGQRNSSGCIFHQGGWNPSGCDLQQG